jgi:phosphoglycerate-specific signal transduction histidine kinase
MPWTTSTFEIETNARRRIIRRLLPFLFTLFVIAFLDRVNVSYAGLDLMMNSIDAMKAVDGTLELAIKSRADNEQLLVTISDTGVGLPSGQADQIFNAFFTTKPHGTGMGLRICRSIVESHGGRLWAAASGRGSTFQFTLSLRGSSRWMTRSRGSAESGCLRFTRRSAFGL